MNLKPYLPRTLQKKRFLALLFIAALLAAGTFSGCASKTKDKTKTKETESQEDTDDLTSKETPTEISAIEKEEEDSDTVIAPNTVHDPDENGESKKDSESSSNTASNQATTSKPVVDPATEPELETETGDLDTETADNMIPLFDSIIIAASEYGMESYDPSSPDFIWTALSLAIVNYAEEGTNGVYYTEDYMHKIVPASVVLEYASGMFSGMSTLPAVPDSLSQSVVYLKEKDSYQFVSSDRGASFTTVTGITPENGGTYLINTSLRTHSDEGTYVVHSDQTFRVAVNTYSGSSSKSLFPYTIREIVSIITY